MDSSDDEEEAAATNNGNDDADGADTAESAVAGSPVVCDAAATNKSSGATATATAMPTSGTAAPTAPATRPEFGLLASPISESFAIISSGCKAGEG